MDPLTKCLAPKLFNEHVISMGIVNFFDLLDSGSNMCMPFGWNLLGCYQYIHLLLSHMFYSQHIMVDDSMRAIDYEDL